MWVNKFEDYNAAWYKKRVEDFNKAHENSIQVKLSVVPGDAWAAKLKTAQAAGTAPEIVNTSYNLIAPAAQAGQIMAMDDYVAPSTFDDLYDNVNQFVSVKGKHYAYPMLVEPSALLFYRKDLFTAAGLDPEKPPTTWAEMLDYAKKLTKNGVFGLQMAANGVEYAWTSWGLQMWFGHRSISDDWSKATVVDDGYKQLIGFYKQFADAKVVPKQAFAGGYADITPLAQGKVAMATIGSWAIGALRNDFKAVTDKIGVAVLPTPDGDFHKPTASLGGWTLAIDGKAKHPKEAAEAITWILGGEPAAMVDFFKASQFSKFSARKSVDELINQDPAASGDAWHKLIAENVVAYATSEPIFPFDISIMVGNAIERSVLKGQDPPNPCSKQKEINDYIATKNLAGTNPLQ